MLFLLTGQVWNIVDIIIFLSWGIYKNYIPGGWRHTNPGKIEIMAEHWGPVPRRDQNMNLLVINEENSSKSIVNLV